MSTLNHFKRIRSVTRLLKTVRGEAEKPVSIALIAEPQVEADILAKLQIDRQSNVVFSANSLSDEKAMVARLKDADLALVVISPGKSNKDLEQMVKQASLADRKLVVVTGRDIDDWLVENLADVFRVSGEDVVFIPVSDDTAVRTILLPRVLQKIKDKEVALAAAVPAFKEEVATRIIAETARQNAVIGVAIFIPGADMPLMTINQIRMILRLSAAYNQELSAKRLYEVLAVVGGGLAFREVARQTLSVIPVAGWAVKGGIAYGGTIAMGRLARKYFENEMGEILGPLATNREDTAESRKTESLYKS